MHIGRDASGKPCPTVLNMARKREFVLKRRENIMKGREALARKYKGHRVLPGNLMDDLEKSNVGPLPQF